MNEVLEQNFFRKLKYGAMSVHLFF